MSMQKGRAQTEALHRSKPNGIARAGEGRAGVPKARLAREEAKQRVPLRSTGETENHHQEANQGQDAQDQY